MTMFPLVGNICPDVGIFLASDGYPLVEGQTPALIYNALGTTSVLLLCLLCILKLTLPSKTSRYLTRVVMAFVFLRLGLVGLCALAPVSRAQDAAGVPSDDDSVGKPVLPNDMDPNAVNAQDVCPGYIASDVKTTGSGLTASLNLAGPGCSAYGNDIENLTLTVEYQDSNRLHVGIQPRFIGAENETWFILPDVIVPKPSADGNTDSDSNDFALSWTNDPTFSFTVTRKSTGEILFTTEGSKIVYEDQFIEFVSPLPENYNLYGLGEVIHGFRLGNNLTSEFRRAILHGE